MLGTVQGVGFRPHVFRLADELGLAGWVRNDERGVVLEVEGDERRASSASSSGSAPRRRRWRWSRRQRRRVAALGASGFEIAESERGGEPQAPVSPDTATCQDCLAELFDPADRRHRYPFVNCTNCGPRFSIVRGVPYDRPLTTMAGFAMCERCRAEYEDPRDRRFHAQPNACPDCGPRVRLIDTAGRAAAACAPARTRSRPRRRCSRDGAILAVKGIGGYHLACRRRRRGAPWRRCERASTATTSPSRCLSRDLDGARELVELTPAEEALLSGPQRPIVIARRRRGAAVATGVAPRSATSA